MSGGNFEVAQGNPNDTLTYSAWPEFSLIDISAGEDKTNLQSVTNLMINPTLQECGPGHTRGPFLQPLASDICIFCLWHPEVHDWIWFSAGMKSGFDPNH